MVSISGNPTETLNRLKREMIVSDAKTREKDELTKRLERELSDMRTALPRKESELRKAKDELAIARREHERYIHDTAELQTEIERQAREAASARGGHGQSINRGL